MSEENAHLLVREHSPVITMDTSLGRFKKNFDFDLESFNQLLDKEGIGDERSELHIHFRDPAHMKLRRRGEYWDDAAGLAIFSLMPSCSTQSVTTNHYMEVKARNSFLNSSARMDRKTNRTLLHETRHYLQGREGWLLSSGQRLRRNIGYKTIGTLGGAALAYGEAKLGWSLLSSPEASPDSLGIGAGLVLASPFALMYGYLKGKVWAYKYDPNEMDARKYAKQTQKALNNSLFSRHKTTA